MQLFQHEIGVWDCTWLYQHNVIVYTCREGAYVAHRLIYHIGRNRCSAFKLAYACFVFRDDPDEIAGTLNDQRLFIGITAGSDGDRVACFLDFPVKFLALIFLNINTLFDGGQIFFLQFKFAVLAGKFLLAPVQFLSLFLLFGDIRMDLPWCYVPLSL